MLHNDYVTWNHSSSSITVDPFMWCRTLVVCLAALSSGCATVQWLQPTVEIPLTEQGHIYVCLDLPNEQLPAAHVAVTQWDRSLHRWKHVVAIDGGRPWLNTCTVWVHETSKVPQDDRVNHRPLAWTSMVGGSEILMRKGWYERDTAGILMHEMGHAFGAQHVGGTLMDQTWSPHTFECPDATTVAQVAAWNQINIELLGYCYR